MKDIKLLISALDVLLIFLIMFLLSFYAIRYDADKGLGEHDYVKVNKLLEGDDNISGDWQSFDYIAIVLKSNQIVIYRYRFGDSTQLDLFKSVDEMLSAKYVNVKNSFVIYEQENNPYLADIIRAFAVRNIPIGIAKVSA